jgi:hypothetical protein
MQFTASQLQALGLTQEQAEMVIAGVLNLADTGLRLSIEALWWNAIIGFVIVLVFWVGSLLLLRHGVAYWNAKPKGVTYEDASQFYRPYPVAIGGALTLITTIVLANQNYLAIFRPDLALVMKILDAVGGQ